jgi:hypothetical protein
MSKQPEPALSRGQVTPEELEWAIETYRRMDVSSEARFSEDEKKAITMIGCAAWAADITVDDPRLADLPDARKLVEIMASKRALQ